MRDRTPSLNVVSLLLIAALSVACQKETSPTSTGTITGLVPTGAQFAGTADTSWQLQCSQSNASGPACPTVGFGPAQRADRGYFEWLVPPAGAAWVGMNSLGTIEGSSGDDAERFVYTYRLTFNVTGGDARRASVSLRWAADNYFGGWRLNSGPFQGGRSQNRNWLSLETLTIDSSNASFASGPNTLEFRIIGDGQTDGFLATSLVGTMQ